jgi:hypothetical protein
MALKIQALVGAETKICLYFCIYTKFMSQLYHVENNLHVDVMMIMMSTLYWTNTLLDQHA